MSKTVVVACVVIVSLLFIVGPMDYAGDLEREAELKVLRAELASCPALQPPRARPLPLHAKCAPRQYYADQPDGGAWLVRCVDLHLSVDKARRP